MTAKKGTKKCAARAKLLFCFSKPIASLTFSLPSSDLKVAILERKRGPWSRHYSFYQNVVVGETSHQILEIFHLPIGRGLSIR